MKLDLNLGLAKHLGMKFLEATPERVVAEIEVREEVCTLGGAIHGGTLMAVADTAGALSADPDGHGWPFASSAGQRRRGIVVRPSSATRTSAPFACRRASSADMKLPRRS